MSSDPGPAGASTVDRTQRLTDRADALRRELENAFNHGDFAMAREVTAADAITHDPTLPREAAGMSGVEPFVEQVSAYRNAFPDLRLTVEDTVSEGDHVAARWRAEGTHRGRLRGLAPTGVRASVTGISITRWEGDRVVESWVEWDNMGLARQIGALPPEGGLVERAATAVQRLVAPVVRRRAGR